MVNTSTLSNHDKYKYFTVYFLIPAYSFNPKAAFWAVLENRTWKNGPRTETESAPEGPLYLLPKWKSYSEAYLIEKNNIAVNYQQ